MKIVTIASTLTGNKGAAAMFIAVVEKLRQTHHEAEITMLSYYPEKDRKVNEYRNVTIQSAKPLYLGLIINPCAFVYRFIPFLRPVLKKIVPEIKSISEADIFLDQGGITFVDGREKFLLFNVATILPALILKKPIVKCSQAMGPFNKKINRLIASYILPKIDKIFARGMITWKHLQSLELKNIELASDLAFSLPIPNEVIADGKKSQLNSLIHCEKITIGISPSVVMEKSMKGRGIDYAKVLSNVIDEISRKKTYEVILIPHSSRPGSKKMHNNDLLLCNKIYSQLKNKSVCKVIPNELGAIELRFLIGKCKYYISSRFHAMISAIAMQVPVLVIGWSHKYEEVLDQFDVEKYAISEMEFNYEKILNSFDLLVDNEHIVIKKINDNLSTVQKSSMKQIDYILNQIKYKDG